MKYTLTILFFLFCFSALSQESTESIEVSLEDVQNANARVTNELDKLNKQLRKKLGKQYPDFTAYCPPLEPACGRQGGVPNSREGGTDALGLNSFLLSTLSARS